MAFEKLTKPEQEIILQSMMLILQEPFISDRAFRTRFGITREELRQVIHSYPDLHDEDEKNEDERKVAIAINNSLNEILHGVRIPEEVWDKWFDVPRDEVRRIFRTWRIHKGDQHTGIM